MVENGYLANTETYVFEIIWFSGDLNINKWSTAPEATLVLPMVKKPGVWGVGGTRLKAHLCKMNENPFAHIIG